MGAMTSRSSGRRSIEPKTRSRPLEVEDGLPEGYPTTDPLEDTVVPAPRLDREELQEMAQRLTKNM